MFMLTLPLVSTHIDELSPACLLLRTESYRSLRALMSFFVVCMAREVVYGTNRLCFR